MNNYYEILGITTDASTSFVKENFKSKKTILQKDLTSRDTDIAKQAAKQIATLTEAYKVLSDVNQRRDYDASLGIVSNFVDDIGSSFVDEKKKVSSKLANNTRKNDSSNNRNKKNNNNDVLKGHVPKYDNNDYSNEGSDVQQFRTIIAVLSIIVVGLLIYIANAFLNKPATPKVYNGGNMLTNALVNGGINAMNKKIENFITNDLDKALQEERKKNPYINNNNNNQSNNSIGVKKKITFEDAVKAKNVHDDAISFYATDINNHIAKNGNLRNAHNLLENISRRENKILDFAEKYMNSSDNNPQKRQLLELFNLEITRIQALKNGVRVGIAGGDYTQEFQKGTKASYEFDEKNKIFGR